MKKILRCLFVVAALGCGASAHAQMTFTVDDMYKLNATQWKYGTVECDSDNPVTSIIVTMKNNEIAISDTGPQPDRTVHSLGFDPRTALYLFTPAITAAQVRSFVEGMTFTQVDLVDANPSVDISVDANPTFLPPGVNNTITAWMHPDGTTHYYIWVPEASITWTKAYNDAKKYYFQGMRGYLATMTSALESKLLTNISELGGWSGGLRTTSTINDTMGPISQPTHSTSTTGAALGTIYRWACGPETDFQYYKGPTRSSSGAGVLNGAFTDWYSGEPNNSGTEYFMQVNFGNLQWNDLPHSSGTPQGYFIEFGGTGQPYSVGAANYPLNTKYHTPTVDTTNDQWVGFSPGNRSATVTTFKPNAMRSNVLVIE